MPIGSGRRRKRCCPRRWRKLYSIDLFTVSRTGAAHDSYADGTVRSAKEIREILGKDPAADAWKNHVPENAAGVYLREIRQGRGPVDTESIEQAILSRLRLLSSDEIMNLPETDGGVGELFHRSIQTTGSLQELLMSVKHKNIALSRVRRLVLAAALGFSREMAGGEPEYIRVLSFNERGRMILHHAEPALPLLTKTAHLQREDGPGRELFELGSRAHDLYVLGFRDPCQWVCGEDWKKGPVIVEPEI